MKECRKDLRIIKTNKNLVQTFFDLHSQYKIEDITVSLICDASGVNRATFYKHFDDKSDFVEFCVREKFLEINKADPVPENSDGATQFAQAFYVMCKFFEIVGELNVENIDESSDSLSLLVKCCNVNFYAVCKEYFEAKVAEGVDYALSTDALAAKCVGSLIGMVLYYLREKKGVFVEEEYVKLAKEIEADVRARRI